MCGIVGCIGVSEPIPRVLAGLARLEYRGYDSAGLAVLVDTHQPRIDVVRAAGRLSGLEQKVGALGSLPARVAIGHTRWATHGPPTESNAHPHVDCHRAFAIVHN